MNDNYICNLPIECIKQYIIPKDILNTLICSLCNGIFYKPFQCNKCNKIYCRTCIETYQLNNNEKLPCNCNINNYTLVEKNIKQNLSKIYFKCPFNCSDEKFDYINVINHIFQCKNKNVNCPKCNNIIKRSELKNPNEEISKSINISILKDELFQTKDEIRKLLSELNLLKSINKKKSIPKIIKPKEEKKEKEKEKEISKNIINLPPLKEKKEKLKQKISIKNIIKIEPKFIDKCKHFYGNYKPIFACCKKAYPCYICHNENENHNYEFSNKVVCLMCNTIYTQNICPKCHVPQVFKKKSKLEEIFK